MQTFSTHGEMAYVLDGLLHWLCVIIIIVLVLFINFMKSRESTAEVDAGGSRVDSTVNRSCL